VRRTSANHAVIEAWIDAHAASLDPATLLPTSAAAASRIEAVFERIDNARIVVLGELDHWIAEKTQFRLWWLERLTARHRLVLAEEIGHSDGGRIAAYLTSGDTTWLDRVPTFGWEADRRPDRDDRPAGVLRASFDRYPTARFKAAQCQFYRAVRDLGLTRFHGIDVNAVAGAGYADVAARVRLLEPALARPIGSALARVPGETMAAEATRLERLAAACARDPRLVDIELDVRVMADTLRYQILAHPAPDYDALRPAMAWREDMMKRAVDRVLDAMAPDEKLVLMAHALHLVKDDDRVGGAPGAGPGGQLVHSLGHHLARECGEHVYSIWFLFAGGTDAQPFPDLPSEFQFPPNTLNARLGARGTPLVLPTTPDADDPLEGVVGVGHLYNLVASVDLAAQADAIFFLPRVTPLPAA